MRLAVFGGDTAARINKNLRIVNAIAVALGQAADDRNRTFLRDLLEARYRSFIPGTGVFLNRRDRITSVGHLGKDDEFGTIFLRPGNELANFAQVPADLTRPAGN